mmetsp:Transcript_34223/g.41301  ORF Transcript_34223/g.41301 Transcript_34223/m.41301 type:complete len:374 (-) Transcript_34223:39-1160(-)
MSFTEVERRLPIYRNRYVESGACYGNSDSGVAGKFTKCALKPEQCGIGTEFYGHDQSSLKRCNPNNAKIGRCIQEKTCAFRESDCAENPTASNFDKDDPHCTVQRDKSATWDTEKPEYTQFGSCHDPQTDEYFCITSPEVCEESGTEVYKTPAETLKAGVTCDCSRVHTFACMEQDDPDPRAYCSFAADGCRPEYMPRSPHYQRLERNARVSQLDCLLCIKSNTDTPTRRPTKVPTPTTSLPTTVLPTSWPSQAPSNNLTSTPSSAFVVEVQAVNVDFDTKNDTMDSNVFAFVGASAVGLTVIVIIGFFFVRLFKSKSHSDFYHTPPPKVILIEIPITSPTVAEQTAASDGSGSSVSSVGSVIRDDDSDARSI